MKVTFENRYHKSKCTIMVRGNTISPGQAKKLKLTLCGSMDCDCSGELGITDDAILPNGTRTGITPDLKVMVY